MHQASKGQQLFLYPTGRALLLHRQWGTRGGSCNEHAGNGSIRVLKKGGGAWGAPRQASSTRWQHTPLKGISGGRARTEVGRGCALVLHEATKRAELCTTRAGCKESTRGKNCVFLTEQPWATTDRPLWAPGPCCAAGAGRKCGPCLPGPRALPPLPPARGAAVPTGVRRLAGVSS